MKGSGLVKITSLLMIIGGTISGLNGTLTFLNIRGMILVVGNAKEALPLLGTISLVVLSSFIEIVTGLNGFKACKEPETAGKYIIYGIIVAALAFVSLAVNLLTTGVFNPLSLAFSLTIPALYIFGLVQLKNSTPVQ